MANVQESDPEVVACIFSENTSAGGGGMFNQGGSPIVRHCKFVNNSAGMAGGAMVNQGISSNPATTVVVMNCLFAGNTANMGGAISNSSSRPLITNCTFAANIATENAGGMWSNSPSKPSARPSVLNCVFWGNAPNEISGGCPTAKVLYSDVQGGFEGEGNIDADPMFVDISNDDYRLRGGSPCIDAGDGDSYSGPVGDLGGAARGVDDPATRNLGVPAIGSTVVIDMGAHEFQGKSCPADLDCDGQVRVSDLVILLAAWGENPGHIADLDDDGEVRVPDLIILLAEWGACP